MRNCVDSLYSKKISPRKIVENGCGIQPLCSFLNLSNNLNSQIPNHNSLLSCIIYLVKHLDLKFLGGCTYKVGSLRKGFQIQLPSMSIGKFNFAIINQIIILILKNNFNNWDVKHTINLTLTGLDNLDIHISIFNCCYLE